MNTHYEDVGFKRVIMTHKILCNRQGWPGLWDNLKNVLTGNDKVSVSKDATISLYVKHECGQYLTADVQMEIIQ